MYPGTCIRQVSFIIPQNRREWREKTNKKQEQIILSNGEVANMKLTRSNYQNILIVELDGILRVIDKETKTLAQTLGETHNKHAYYVKKS